jgi:hypothetical protein
MATTTPNYGWDVPTSTDYVKDGATAIETLGDDIDASMFAALGGNPAMGVLLNTTTFTSAASVNVNSVFSANYDNYRIQIDYTIAASSGTALNLRFRNAGVDNSTNSHSYALMRLGFNGTTYNAQNTATSAVVLNNSYTVTNFVAADISNPFKTRQKAIVGNVYGVDAASASQVGGSLTGYATLTTAFDGFTLFVTASSITGTLRVYGYRNS